MRSAPHDTKRNIVFLSRNLTGESLRNAQAIRRLETSGCSASVNSSLTMTPVRFSVTWCVFPTLTTRSS